MQRRTPFPRAVGPCTSDRPRACGGAYLPWLRLTLDVEEPSQPQPAPSSPLAPPGVTLAERSCHATRRVASPSSGRRTPSPCPPANETRERRGWDVAGTRAGTATRTTSVRRRHCTRRISRTGPLTGRARRGPEGPAPPPSVSSPGGPCAGAGQGWGGGCLGPRPAGLGGSLGRTDPSDPGATQATKGFDAWPPSGRIVKVS